MIYDDLVKTHELHDRILSGLDTSYDLVYVDRDDRLTDKQVAALVRCDLTALYEELWDYESESTMIGENYVIDEIKRGLSTSERAYFADFEEEVREAVRERSTGTWLDRLISNTPDPLLRLVAVSEDDCNDVDREDPGTVLDIVGFEHSAPNLGRVERALAETPSDVLMGYWLVSIDLHALYEHYEPAEELIIVNPTLMMGNPFTGAYSCELVRLEGAIVVRRDDLRTDADAFGYDTREVYGGLTDDFDCDVRWVPADKED